MDVTAGQGQDRAELPTADEQLLRELTERARTGGLKLTGEGGLRCPASLGGPPARLAVRCTPARSASSPAAFANGPAVATLSFTAVSASGSGSLSPRGSWVSGTPSTPITSRASTTPPAS